MLQPDHIKGVAAEAILEATTAEQPLLGRAERNVELARIKRARDDAASLREQAEWCVEYEEALGGRPPTRGAGDIGPFHWTSRKETPDV